MPSGVMVDERHVRIAEHPDNIQEPSRMVNCAFSASSALKSSLPNCKMVNSWAETGD